MQNLSDTIIASGILGESIKKLEPISYELHRLTTRLINGTIRIGIIGLKKAGKSTFLNALLGKRFLPSSFQPQTANEIVIVHDMSKPEGELYCITEEQITHLASGHKEIYQKLVTINRGFRTETTLIKCDKLELHAPLQFLVSSDKQDLKFEIFNIPGDDEDGVENIAESAIKNMSSFVIIFSSQTLKSDSESKLFKSLKNHRQFFSKLNRMLILVNAHTMVYSEGVLSYDNASISPEKLPEYVLNYSKGPDFLNKEISPAQIHFFHALWALRTREWKDPTVLLKEDEEKAKLLYDEAMLMLRYVGEGEEADALKDDMSDQNINRIISLLEPASQIVNVEEHLRNTVVENGMSALKSAVADMISVINYDLLPIIEDKRIESKQEKLNSTGQLNRNTTFLEEKCGEFEKLVESLKTFST